MESEPIDDGRSKKGRIMGKLFGRDRKTSNEKADGDLDAFLRGTPDTLKTAHAAPPTLAKLDTLSATRYPNALDVQNASQQSLPLRGRSHSPNVKRKKGLVVRFVDTFPEIIGEGGDESETPPSEIGLRRKAQSVPAPVLAPAPVPRQQSGLGERPAQSDDDFVPNTLRRTQTGYSSIAEGRERKIPAGQLAPAAFLDSPVMAHDEKRRSFIEIHQAQMREAEGLALANAARASGTASDQDGEGKGGDDERAFATRSPPAPARDLRAQVPRSQPPSEPVSPVAQVKKAALEGQSPSSIYSTSSVYSTYSTTSSTLNRAYSAFRQNSNRLSEKDSASPQSPKKPAMSLHDVVVAAKDDALDMFVARTRHLFELFRLHSETVRPLLSCSADDLARASLWWFIKGRMALENAVRDRPTSPQAQRVNEMARQQAYADLAKGYWLSEEVLPEILGNKRSPVDGQVDEARQSVMMSLKKMTLSMKRNGLLPPEDAFLPQTIDKSIWVEYPPLSQDIVALLWGSWGSALAASQRPTPTMTISESLPVGDTAKDFTFGRVWADVYLMEQGQESQRFYFPCFLSTVRPVDQPHLELMLATQNGAVQLRIQASGTKTAGPTWDHVRWHPDTCTMKMKLPRGFYLAIQLSQTDYRLIWGMYDFGSRVLSQLYPGKDEQVVFRSTLKSFQYFDSDPNSRDFPKEQVTNCEVGLFERILKEGAATGPRSYHRGFRISVVTGTRTRTLSGISHPYTPDIPVQFGFLRGENDDPALLLKFGNGRSRGSMVLSFADEQERLRLHSLLVGTALHSDEHIFSEVPLASLSISQSARDPDGIRVFQKLPYQRVRIINYEDGTDSPATVLADKLRMVVEFKNGTITDRVNVAPGEFKIRLEVRDPMSLSVLRQPQQDMTVALSEAQVPRELSREMSEGLQVIRTRPTCRRYQFTSLQDLHAFQAALTGYRVLFDGIAATFAISRRRMVVPIHKKWEAGATRIQVVQQQDKITQLLAFFQDFHHGQCMGFVLKGTDVFEAISRSGKFGLKIDDAKFPLPRAAESDGTGGGSSASDDAAFVCLDLPDLPGEHDDISILFEKEADRDKLLSCLPAPVRISRLGSRRN